MNFEEWWLSEDNDFLKSHDDEPINPVTAMKLAWNYQQNIIKQFKEELKKERSAVDDMAKMFNKCRANNCNCVNDIAFYRQKERVNFE